MWSIMKDYTGLKKLSINCAYFADFSFILDALSTKSCQPTNLILHHAFQLRFSECRAVSGELGRVLKLPGFEKLERITLNDAFDLFGLSSGDSPSDSIDRLMAYLKKKKIKVAFEKSVRDPADPDDDIDPDYADDDEFGHGSEEDY